MVDKNMQQQNQVPYYSICSRLHCGCVYPLPPGTSPAPADLQLPEIHPGMLRLLLCLRDETLILTVFFTNHAPEQICRKRQKDRKKEKVEPLEYLITMIMQKGARSIWKTKAWTYQQGRPSLKHVSPSYPLLAGDWLLFGIQGTQMRSPCARPCPATSSGLVLTKLCHTDR